MKNNYFCLSDFNCELMSNLLLSYRFSFNNTISEFLENLAKEYHMKEFIKFRKNNIAVISAESEEELKERCLEVFGEVDILEYFDDEGNRLEKFDSNCSGIKLSRPPVIHDILARYLDYQSESPYFSHEDSFNDIHCSNIIRELRAWYEGKKISVIRHYSHLDMFLCHESRCVNNVDKHIPKQFKAKIICDLFSHITLDIDSRISINQINDMLDSLNFFNSYGLNNTTKKIESLTENIVNDSNLNTGFLKFIGFNPEYIGNRDKSAIVVSHIAGSLANKNLFTGKITHISKYYNNDNDPNKSYIYFEESEITINKEWYKVATAEDIYTYRENYYLPDGTRPFLNMVIKDIEEYLENK